VLWQAGAWREELIQLLLLLAERADRRLHPLPWALPVPLRVHGHYSRAEIEAAYCYAEACGYGVLADDAPWIHREGVLWLQASATDLLFISLRKSEALFSPSTRYRAASPTEPFVCLGFARYASHEGERPMAIRRRLEREIPAAWLHGCCVAHQLLLGIKVALAV
jgi:hypothetical protein